MPANYLAVAEDIARKIDSGELQPGDKLPSTRELCAEYGVSETVIRFAMVHLRALKLVEGRAGVGVFVAERPAPES